MKRLITLATTALAVGSLGVFANTSPASAAGDPVIGMEVLDMLCVMRGGTAYTTPFTISRCQEARSKHGFVIEELICEGLLDGNFGAAPSHNRPKRTTWVCSPGAPAA
jgi:hypothetical protein